MLTDKVGEFAGALLEDLIRHSRTAGALREVEHTVYEAGKVIGKYAQRAESILMELRSLSRDLETDAEELKKKVGGR